MNACYCEKCGLLHNPDDGKCLGCKLIAKIKNLEDNLADIHNIAMLQSSEYARDICMIAEKLL